MDEKFMSDLKDPRVLFAAERTLLAWNRTSIGLIAFGFLVERSGLLIRAIEQTSSRDSLHSSTFFLGIFEKAMVSLCMKLSSRVPSICMPGPHLSTMAERTGIDDGAH